MEIIDAYLASAIQQKADSIEVICERMLVTRGAFGVRVDEWGDGGWSVGLSADVEPMCVSTFRHEGSKPVAKV